MRIIIFSLWACTLTHFKLLPIEARMAPQFDQTPKFVLLAPWEFRVGTKETILLEAFELYQSISVSLLIQDYPLRTTTLWRENIILTPDNQYSVLKALQLDPSLLHPEEKESKHIELTAKFGHYQEVTHVSRVSFNAGYVFIQTDKPVYNPGDKVFIRTLVSSTDFKSFDGYITSEIQNSDGITIHSQSTVKAEGGINSFDYVLPDIASEGKWKIVSRFDHRKENTFSTEFEVKKYVLPAFNVTLIPKKSYFSLEDTQLDVEVYARYLYGKNVEGVAYVVFGVERNGQKIRVTSMKQVKNLDGGIITLTMDELKREYPDISNVKGLSIYIKASVMTSSGSDLVEAEKTGIRVISSPYTLAIKNTATVYKAGQPFAMTITVSNHDGSPAPNVPVSISLLPKLITMHSGTIKVSLNMPSNDENFNIEVNTVVPNLKSENQAKVKWFVRSYIPYNIHRKNQLYISVDSELLKVGHTMNVNIHLSLFSPQEKEYLQKVSYAVLSKGKIINGGKVNIARHDVTILQLPVTAAMAPAFYVVVYYILPWQGAVEVEADTVFLEMESHCVGSQLKVDQSPDDIKKAYSPGEYFHYRVSGDPGAKVGLVAVDNAVFLLSKNRLTQNKIWQTLSQGDTKNDPGRGINTVDIFQNAKLSFRSNFGVSVGENQASHPGIRGKRNAERLQLQSQIKQTYTDQFLQRCCTDGMRNIPMPYSCHRRALYITETWNCVLAFLTCCTQYRGEEMGIVTPPPPTTAEPPTTTTPQPFLYNQYINRHFSIRQRFGRVQMAAATPLRPSVGGRRQFLTSLHVQSGMNISPEEDDSEAEDFEEDQIFVRKNFDESWLWNTIQLPTQVNSDGLAVASLSDVLPDSITEWSILGVSASPTTGFCVAEPYKMKSFKQFFVDIRLPRTAARNELLEAKIVLHNYMKEDLEVMVIVAKTVDICSAAFNEDYKQQVSVQKDSSIMLPMTIIPLRAGELSLKVTAVSNSFGNDAIIKTLRVVVEGIQKLDVRSFVLNPTEHGGSGERQLITVKKAELNSVVPNSEPETFVNVRGNLLADSIDNSINKDSLATLIRMPGGCVEQNLASITLPLLAVHYLDRSKEWESVGVQRRDEALGYIKKGYEKQLQYRKSDHSYPPYRNEGTSTWITAFVVKVLSMANQFIPVDKSHICEPLLYLLRNKQLSSGAFKEDNPVYSTTMMGGLQGAESRETLTAFVLIALAEAQDVVECTDPNIDVKLKFKKAGDYLRERYQRLSRPYSVAIVCYALAVSNQGFMKSMLQKVASPDQTHWPDESNSYFTLEATGYALLALLKGGHVEEAAKSFKWLNRQRRVGGGYGSTQSTVVVLQAISEYMVKRPTPSNMIVALQVPGRSDKRWDFTPSLAHVARSSRVPISEDFNVVASGQGQGILEVVTVYNQLPDVHEMTTCNGFDLSVSITESSEKPLADVEKVYKLSISVRAKAERQVRMVVLDISIPTGFEPETKDLQQLNNAVDRYINNFQVVDNLSNQGSLIIHLFKVSNKEAEIIPFRLNQKFKVGLLQPSVVTVYQYYNKDKQCSRFYTPPEDKKQLSQICKDNICRCTENDCAVLKTDAKPADLLNRRKAACSGINHAFKARVLRISASQYDRYELEIQLLIKDGAEVGLMNKDKRMFLSHASCRNKLNLIIGQDYLIIGPSSDIWQRGSDQNGFTYILGSNTWVEHWPSTSECESTAKGRCTQLDTFTNELLNEGCQS